MSKRLPGEAHSPKHAQENSLPRAYGEESSQIIEMAAEQLADLLWRHWLYTQKLKKKSSKEQDS